MSTCDKEELLRKEEIRTSDDCRDKTGDTYAEEYAKARKAYDEHVSNCEVCRKQER